MEQKIAKVFSVLFHPVFLPLFVVFIVFMLPFYPFSFYSPLVKYIVLALILVFNVLTPLFMIFLLTKSGFVSSFSMENKRERILPLLMFAFLLYVSSAICKRWELPLLWNVTLLLMAMITLSSLLVNLFRKISLHMIAWGSLTGLLIFIISFYHQANYIILLSFVFMISGIVAWSRATMKAHSTLQLLGGYALGCLMMWGGLMVVFM